MTEELIKKAKEAKSVEDLIILAKDNGIELQEKEAEAYFESLHKSGEIEDDELDSVSGGACHITSNYFGKKCTVVTSACKCFTGMYERDKSRTAADDWYGPWFKFSREGCCGYCTNLWIQDGIGYCCKTAR